VRLYEDFEDGENIYLILELCENKVRLLDVETLSTLRSSYADTIRIYKKERPTDRARSEILHVQDISGIISFTSTKYYASRSEAM